MILDRATRFILLHIEANTTTYALAWVSSSRDLKASIENPITEVGTVSLTATDAIVVPAPVDLQEREVKHISVANNDTVPAQVSIHMVDVATRYRLVKVILQPNDTLMYTSGEGWQVMQSNGAIKSSSYTSSDLDAIAALTGTGFLVRKASATWATETIAGTANQVTVTNGDGVAGAPVVSLPSAITTPGSLTMGGLLGLGAIGQIKFPATQNSSSDVNTLDDYEEGTWTPVLQGTTTAGTATYFPVVATYTKIGNMVSINAVIGWSSFTGTGNLQIAGLPFAFNATSFAAAAMYCGLIVAMTASNIGVMLFFAGSTVITIKQQATGTGAQTNVPVAAGGQTQFSGVYPTAT